MLFFDFKGLLHIWHFYKHFPSEVFCMPDVIMWYRGGGGCELYIHSAPSWQQCLLTPQSSQLLVHPQLSCIYVWGSSHWIRSEDWIRVRNSKHSRYCCQLRPVKSIYRTVSPTHWHIFSIFMDREDLQKNFHINSHVTISVPFSSIRTLS